MEFVYLIMKKFKFQKLFLAFTMAIAVVAMGCSKDEGGDTPQPKKGKITFIYYSQVDEGIGEEAYKQIPELRKSASSDYRILAMSNFPKSYRAKLASDLGLTQVGTLQLQMEGGNVSKVLANSGATLIDMSKPETFTECLNKAAEIYPAEEYVIMFNGHGSGWDIAEDGTRSTPIGESSMRGLTVSGISKAIKSSTVNGKVKLIYFDACLMAGFEYLGDLAPYTSYIVGTPTVSWTVAGKIEKLVTIVKGTSDWAGVSKQMAAHMAEAYKELWAVSLAVSTEKVPVLFAKVKTLNDLLFEIAQSDESKRLSILAAANATFSFNEAEEDEGEMYGFETESVTTDVRSLVDFYYRAKSIDVRLERPYADFVAALDNVVIASFAGVSVNGLAQGNTRYGLSMLLFNKNIYETQVKNTFYKNLIFKKEANPEKLFSLFYN